MSEFPLVEAVLIIGAGLFGAVAVLPYLLEMQKDQLANVPLSRSKLIPLIVLQSGVLVTLATVLGLLATRAVGLGAPLLETALGGENALPALLNVLPLAILVGVLAGALIVVLDRFVFGPHLPAVFHKLTGEIPLWKRFLASFYGGITEEILMRLFLFSGIAWLLGLIWQTPGGLPADGAFWTANVLAALVFGVAHLPATAALTRLTPLVILRALALNGVAGIAFGYLYWQHGLIVAMMAHFSADIILHVITPLLLKPQAGEQTVAPTTA